MRQPVGVFSEESKIEAVSLIQSGFAASFAIQVVVAMAEKLMEKGFEPILLKGSCQRQWLKCYSYMRLSHSYLENQIQYGF